MVILGILAFFLMLGLLFLIHEGGHFLGARLFGIRVEEVGLGFGPTLRRGIFRGQPWALNLIPLGAYVKLFGEEGSADGSSDSFAAQPIFAKFLVIAAGIFGNWLTAAALFSVLFVFGMPRVVTHLLSAPQNGVTIFEVAQNSPADIAGIMPEDRIIAIRSQERSVYPNELKDIQNFVSQHAGEEITLVLTRADGSVVETVTIPRKDPPEGEGALGVGFTPQGVMRVAWYEAPWRGLFFTAHATVFVVKAMGQAAVEALSFKVPEGVAGPIGIAVLSVDATRAGIGTLMVLAAFISLSLAVLNAIPFPALDGSRIVQIAVEEVLGKKVPEKVLEVVYGGGLAFLLIIGLFIAYQDVQRYVIPRIF